MESREVDVEKSVEYYQENGRLEPASNEEVASALGVNFICPACSCETIINKKQFGEKISCPECETRMVQQI